MDIELFLSWSYYKQCYEYSSSWLRVKVYISPGDVICMWEGWITGETSYSALEDTPQWFSEGVVHSPPQYMGVQGIRHSHQHWKLSFLFILASWRQVEYRLVLLMYLPLAMDKGSLFGWCGCCNILPHSWWLKTTWIYSMTVLQAESLKSSSSTAELTLEALGKTCSLSLPASGVCWHSLACGCITPASVYMSPFPCVYLCQNYPYGPLTRTRVIARGTHPVIFGHAR